MVNGLYSYSAVPLLLTTARVTFTHSYSATIQFAFTVTFIYIPTLPEELSEALSGSSIVSCLPLYTIFARF